MSKPPFPMKQTIVGKPLSDFKPTAAPAVGWFGEMVKHLTPADAFTISQIVDRYGALMTAAGLPWTANNRLLASMDLTVCHLRARPLKLGQMLMTSDAELADDMANICRELDRVAGVLPDYVRLHCQDRAS